MEEKTKTSSNSAAPQPQASTTLTTAFTTLAKDEKAVMDAKKEVVVKPEAEPKSEKDTSDKGKETASNTSKSSEEAKPETAQAGSEAAIPLGSEKRPREASEEDIVEESKRKKSKKEETPATPATTVATSTTATTSATSSTATTASPSKPSRGTRGSSSEKILGGGAKIGGAKTSSRALTASERRTSPASSAINSPKKPASRDHSDEEDAEAKKLASNEPKVPPLKIVLSAGQNGNGNNGTATSAATSEDKKSPTASVLAEKDEVKVASDKTVSKEITAAESGGEPSPATASDAFEDTDSKGGNNSSSTLGTRLTRSRANQGTPGPGDQAGDSPGTSASLNQCDNANLEPATIQATISPSSAASTSMAPQGGSSASMLYTDYQVKKRKLRSQVEISNELGNANGASTSSAGASGGGGGICEAKSNQSKSSAGLNVANNEPLNDIEKYLNIRKQVEQRRKNLFPVQPKPPQGFKDYLMNRKTYLLQENAHERLRSIPMIQPPPSLDGPLRDLFKTQEEERYKLRMKHVVEKEKLVLAVEQEILRVHGRAARALANQSLPYSVCTILRDEEIYTPIDPQQEEKNRDIRSRYNGRLFLSWLQDVDDKWEKIKEQMVLRHHNEAESLNAVQKMDWEWKVNEILGGNAPGNDGGLPQMDDLHIPMVHVSDDFDLSNS